MFFMQGVMAKQLSLLIFSAFLAVNAYAQEINIKLSEKHLNKVEKAESGREKLKKYRKYYQKDSSKQMKELKKYWQAKSDSLSKAQQNNEQLANLKQQLPDSTVTDSLKSKAVVKAKAMASQNEEVQAIKSEADQYSQELTVAENIGNKDSLKSSARGYGEKRLAQAQSKAGSEAGLGDLKKQEEELMKNGALGQYEEYNPEEYTSKMKEEVDVEKYKDQVDQYTDQKKVEETAKKQAKEKAVNFFKTKADILTPAQKKLAKLRQKYQSIANSDSLDNAVKKNSLEGKPLRERLFIGGHFNVNSTDPLSIDLSPKLGYKINKRWVIGIGGTYRRTFGNDSLATALNVPKDGYGFNGFTSYDAFRGFFLYGEYERMTKKEKLPNSEEKESNWVDGAMLGVGKKFSVHPKVNMQIIAMYNFLHRTDNALFTRPYTVKVGFSLSELALLKK